jgi:hypothetical protein
VRSARGASSAWIATVPLAVLLTGCVSTQTTAARVRLANARLVAATQPTVVLRANPEVSVGTTVLIHGRAGTAVVVSLRNNSSRALTDLPISVGVITRSGRMLYLNRSASEDYFASHVPAIGSGSATTWVFVTSRRVAARRVFAVAGFPTLRSSVAGELPPIAISTRAAGDASGQVTVSVTNRSAIPQYDLPLYVVASRDGHAVAAGNATVAHLGTHGTTTLHVSLVGTPGQAALRLIALPTIFS